MKKSDNLCDYKSFTNRQRMFHRIRQNITDYEVADNPFYFKDVPKPDPGTMMTSQTKDSYMKTRALTEYTSSTTSSGQTSEKHSHTSSGTKVRKYVSDRSTVYSME